MVPSSDVPKCSTMFQDRLKDEVQDLWWPSCQATYIASPDGLRMSFLQPMADQHEEHKESSIPYGVWGKTRHSAMAWASVSHEWEIYKKTC